MTCASSGPRVSVPVLAKEFVVDPRQLDLLRAAGADLVLLLAVLHPARRLAALVAAAQDLGLEPLVEAHNDRELDAALATTARLIGVNNRDLRSLDVDPERAVVLRDAIPGDRIAIAESGVRDAVGDRPLAGNRLRRRARGRGADACSRPGRRRPLVRGRGPGPRRYDGSGTGADGQDLRDHRRRRCPGGGPGRGRRDRPQLRARHPARAVDRRGRGAGTARSPGRRRHGRAQGRGGHRRPAGRASSTRSSRRRPRHRPAQR